MIQVTVFVAFIAGIVSFLSPCVLPIVPGFLAYLAGVSSSSKGSASRFSIFLNSFFFVLGFSIIFAILGVLLNTVLAGAAYGVQLWLARLGGAIVIFFGLYLMGLLKIGFLEYEHKFNVRWQFHSRYLTSLVFGFAFAVGWTPCVGAVLGGILGLAAAAPSQAFSLLLAYALGLGVPFLIVGLFVSQSSGLIKRYAAALKYLNFVFGLILVVLGILVFTQSLSLIANLGFLNNLLLK